MVYKKWKHNQKMSKNDTAIATVLCDTVNHHTTQTKTKLDNKHTQNNSPQQQQQQQQRQNEEGGGGSGGGGVSMSVQTNSKAVIVEVTGDNNCNSDSTTTVISGTGKPYNSNNNNNIHNSDDAADKGFNSETAKTTTVFVSNTTKTNGDANFVNVNGINNNVTAATAPTTSINNVIFNKSLDTTISSTSTPTTIINSSTPNAATNSQSHNHNSGGGGGGVSVSGNNGCWRDYKKLKTYLILKDKQNEKVIEIIKSTFLPLSLLHTNTHSLCSLHAILFE